MRIALTVALAAALAAAAPAVAEPGLTIDVPVKLAEAKVVFNLDHLAFEGDTPTGMDFIRIMLRRFKEDGTKHEIVAIFHGPAGYMLLGDEAYDRERNWTGGNPYKALIAEFMEAGVSIEECGMTMQMKGWKNAEMLPGVKINTGANFRIIELVQKGFVAIQP